MARESILFGQRKRVRKRNSEELVEVVICQLIDYICSN